MIQRALRPAGRGALISRNYPLALSPPESAMAVPACPELAELGKNVNSAKKLQNPYNS